MSQMHDMLCHEVFGEHLTLGEKDVFRCTLYMAVTAWLHLHFASMGTPDSGAKLVHVVSRVFQTVTPPSSPAACVVDLVLDGIH